MISTFLDNHRQRQDHNLDLDVLMRIHFRVTSNLERLVFKRREAILQGLEAV